MGSDGSKAESGIPAACAAASKAAFEAVAAALEDDEGLDLDLGGGPPPPRGDPLCCCPPLLSPQ